MPATHCATCREPVVLIRDDDRRHRYVHERTWFCPAAGGDQS
ncbi:hypothetical protein M2280_005301 [Prescottella agglutinans]|uniref:Uncharacterized protein n=1 Tax=Prescottella agglutinans TaxID=1644129 RepID=A0ABT6MII6_9NOCA|nr:hypothetical protein [Prescottella agglutinans]